jgi:hypothetical protein
MYDAGGGKRACVGRPSCSNSNTEEGLSQITFMDYLISRSGGWIVGGKSGEKEGGKQKLGTQDRNTRGARNVIPDHLVCVARASFGEGVGDREILRSWWTTYGAHEIGFYRSEMGQGQKEHQRARFSDVYPRLGSKAAPGEK